MWSADKRKKSKSQIRLWIRLNDYSGHSRQIIDQRFRRESSQLERAPHIWEEVFRKKSRTNHLIGDHGLQVVTNRSRALRLLTTYSAVRFVKVREVWPNGNYTKRIQPGVGKVEALDVFKIHC
jgi:hypothetical protein